MSELGLHVLLVVGVFAVGFAAGAVFMICAPAAPIDVDNEAAMAAWRKRIEDTLSLGDPEIPANFARATMGLPVLPPSDTELSPVHTIMSAVRAGDMSVNRARAALGLDQITDDEVLK